MPLINIYLCINSLSYVVNVRSPTLTNPSAKTLPLSIVELVFDVREDLDPCQTPVKVAKLIVLTPNKNLPCFWYTNIL